MSSHIKLIINRVSVLSYGLLALALFAAITVSPDVQAAGTTGDFGKDLSRTTTLHHFQVDKEKFVGQRFEFNCPEVTVRDKTPKIVGTGVYPANSPICVAAQHDGVIGVDGGTITLQLNPGLSEYHGSVSNNVESTDFPGTKLSIMFLSDSTRSELDKIQADWIPRLKWKSKFSQTGLANIRLTGQRFAYDCPRAPENLAGRRVYGTDSYPLNSYVCMAAVHAGQITTAGGQVLVQMDPALESKFAGSSRNGIESKNGPKSARSISFPGGGNHGTVASADSATGNVDLAADTKKAKSVLKKSARSLFD
ncbi:MAG: LCCL domain-containing protein [Pseudomonadota bacterium]